jgi:hypothetical protein
MRTQFFVESFGEYRHTFYLVLRDETVAVERETFGNVARGPIEETEIWSLDEARFRLSDRGRAALEEALAGPAGPRTGQQIG